MQGKRVSDSTCTTVHLMTPQDANVNLVGRSSMEVGVHVESEQVMTGEVRHTTSAFLTYVALDENGRPTDIPPLILETEEEKIRYQEAQVRREVRLQERKRDE